MIKSAIEIIACIYNAKILICGIKIQVKKKYKIAKYA